MKDFENYYEKMEVLKSDVRTHVEVFQALHKPTKILTCVKKINLKKLQVRNKIFTSLQEHEIESLKRVDNPYTVRVFSLLQNRSYQYIVTEYVSGGTLQDIMDE